MDTYQEEVVSTTIENYWRIITSKRVFTFSGFQNNFVGGVRNSGVVNMDLGNCKMYAYYSLYF